MFSVGCGIIAEDVDGRLFRLMMRCFVEDLRDLQVESFGEMLSNNSDEPDNNN